MFRLTNKLAVSNLIKTSNSISFALAALLAVTITYLFYSLPLNPQHYRQIRGRNYLYDPCSQIVVVTIASGIIVLYANSFVAKNAQGAGCIWYAGS